MRIELQKQVFALEAQLQQLQSGQAPGPCGQQGHLILHVRYLDRDTSTGGTFSSHCILCEQQAKLLEAAEHMTWMATCNTEKLVGDPELYVKHVAVIREARAAAAIAEEAQQSATALANKPQ